MCEVTFHTARFVKIIPFIVMHKSWNLPLAEEQVDEQQVHTESSPNSAFHLNQKQSYQILKYQMDSFVTNKQLTIA